ncbi:MAG TPA: hypothetical protein VE954_26470 [Oligoflexus sp.]|uniref:hypothetical protein n=1 Tax=Oligoflexus sp. TaxID=1971216 RepID=UPI002D4265C2|nr:hypothetical protein [Oligoflexus sp.]HYX36670.1 hypothetical protein [Oligoflexus sp.]
MQKLLVPFQIRHCLLIFLIGLGGFALVSCDSLQNKIDQRELACGAMDGDLQNLSWIQIKNDKAEVLDLNQSAFSVVDSALQPLPSNAYRVSSKGCLGVPQRQEFIVRIPGKKALFKSLEPSDQAFQLLSVQSLDVPLKVHLEPAKSVYQGESSVRIRSSEKSRSRYCLEEVTQVRCIKSSDLNTTISSREFLNLTESIELPVTEGRYRLHVLSEARDGSLSLNPFDFSIDNTAPKVIPDFTERLSSISYFERPTYFVEAGYPIKFLSFNDTLVGTHIEYCLVPQDSPLLVCPNPLIYGSENPLVVSRGASKLVYRAFDEAGNVSSENWQSLSIMSRTACKVSDFLQSVSVANPLNCQILEGDLDLTMMDPKTFPVLDQFIEVTGRIQYKSETTTSIPLFQNLNTALAIDFNLAAELEADFVAFPQLRRLKELNLRLSMGGKSVKAFNEITQLLRGRLANIQNAKELRIFRKLQAVDDELWLGDMGTMTNLDFLSALTRAGKLRVTHHEELRDVKGLKNLASVGNLEIAYNPKLTVLTGLEGVIWVEKLVLSGLAISDFTGLQNLKEVTYGLWVESNEQLVSVKGLDSLIKVSYFMFRDNDRLPAGTQLLGQTIEQ